MELEKYLNKLEFKSESTPQKSWDEYFLRISLIIASRSTCIHRKVGALIVKDKRILSTGYNQPPSGFPHCNNIPCIRDDLRIPSGKNQEICYALHAEQNALMQAAKFGISTNNSTMYITHKPCSVCARLIINAGIKRVVFINDYPDPLTDFLFKVSKIKIEKFGGVIDEQG
ncbi:deoxycytidylate deaminase [Thermosipho melanesiensis]|uniref:CMP/dCMP deaminase, zinc-binding n=2 Tax=Thermosipho melanesiensis TaxID=46541 RepID=A6LNV4_THEM4|nr:cytidine/deoxycytidylate deaminase family protein [Thermosipho melanesiensis]ABR31605.1 CMP/dCMP deaminase, zinc-binding [Thermosipho melanesiensis BI429]APT74636.1 deoxycytidylate deaminase [Thermosipho melanesiensis]OOC35340.1 deoxycytidylate deaminase [Thermosipho melanesiensis]OOC35557.1 deoxycytidylate deaminase [Thermosipho melanesiensis]OOC36594.1 deoxycytidylate deaminase [Thermosipho melanesiensis]